MPSSPPTADSESHVKKKTPRAVTAKRIQQNREAQRVYRDRKKVKASNLDAKLRDLEERNARLDAENMMLKLGAAGAPDSALTDLRSNLVRLKSENEALKQVIVDLELKLALAEASSRDMHRTSATLVSQSNPSIMNSQCTNGAVAREYFEKDSRDRTQPITSTSTKSNVSKRGIHDHLFVSTRDNPISHGNEKGNNSSIDVVDSMRTDEEGWFDILAVNNGHFQSAEDLFGPLAGVEEAILALKKIPSLQNASTSVENMVNAAIVTIPHFPYISS
ncbi:hypothetical protein BC830DRAFT_1155258 [Chytriomyces sp. MP71]|nr:hypothetical protein BC830DRAFT_1155258 [Chytriomyces sp. MP71]